MDFGVGQLVTGSTKAQKLYCGDHFHSEIWVFQFKKLIQVSLLPAVFK